MIMTKKASSRKKTQKGKKAGTVSATPSPTSEATANTVAPALSEETAAPTAAKSARPPKMKITAPIKFSLSRAIKEIVVREPKVTTDALVTKLAEAGFKDRSRVTIATLQSDCVTTLRAAAEAGLFKMD
jgi:hypothetical protein